MAYAFSKLLGSMGQQGQQKQDIFGQGASGQQEQGPQGLSLTGGGGEAIGGQASPSSTTSAKVKDTGADAPSSAANQAAVFSKATPQKSNFVGGVKSGVESAQQKLNEEIAQYEGSTPKQQAIDYKALAQSVLKGGQGSEDAYKQMMSGLQPPKQQAKEFESQVGTDFTDVEKLKSVGGLADLYKQQEGGGEYSGRLARFDAQKLAGEKAFQEQRKAIEDQAKAVRERQQGLVGPGESEIEKTQRTAMEADAEKNRQAILAALQEARGSRLGELRLAAEQANKSAPQKLSQEEIAKYHDQALAELGKENPELLNHLFKKANPYSIAEYYTPQGEVDYADLATEADRANFAKINELLGLGGIAPEEIAAADQAQAAFDLEGYKKKLRNFGQSSIWSTNKGQKEAAQKAAGEAVAKTGEKLDEAQRQSTRDAISPATQLERLAEGAKSAGGALAKANPFRKKR